MGQTAVLNASASRLHAVASDVMKSLVRLDMGEQAAAISLPILFPGGNPVNVFIEPHDGMWMVHDNGSGALEAEMMGALPTYQRIARDVARKADLGFDQRMFFIARVSEEWLPNMVVIIGEASRAAAVRTAEKIAEGVTSTHREIMIDRLSSHFGERSITINASIRGESSHKYEVDALVDLGRSKGRLAFELVSPHENSVSSVFRKFSDLADLSTAPGRVAVLTARERTGNGNIILLGKACSAIIGVNDDEPAWKRLAA